MAKSAQEICSPSNEKSHRCIGRHIHINEFAEYPLLKYTYQTKAIPASVHRCDITQQFYIYCECNWSSITLST